MTTESPLAAAPDRRALVDLLVRTGQGDRQAFSRLYERTHAKLFGIVRRICPNRETAEEVLQESYVAVWRSAAAYDPGRASPIAWMATIARNKAIDQRRLRAEQLSARSVALDERLETGMPDPFEQAERSEELRRLADCLRELPEERRQMVLLAYYQGWSRRELGERFNKPVNTVKTDLRRALAMLQDCIDGRP